MILCYDLDGTLCTQQADGDYTKAEPIRENIEEVRGRFDRGAIVKIWTARGSGTGKDWRAVTERQLSHWGVPYHELRFGKPHADIYIDDRGINTEEWFGRIQ